MKKKVKEARKILEDKWDSEGECGSCGWHGALWEHDVLDYEIEDALKNNDGILELYCVSKDDDENWSHRGIKIDISKP